MANEADETVGDLGMSVLEQPDATNGRRDVGSEVACRHWRWFMA